MTRAQIAIAWLAGVKEVYALTEELALKKPLVWYGAAASVLRAEISKLQQEISNDCAPWFEVKQ